MVTEEKSIVDISCIARERNGGESAFSLKVGVPFFDPKRGCGCEVLCPYLREKPFLIFGVDPYQAASLSLEFIERLLEGRAILLTFEGAPLSLPSVSYEALIEKRPKMLSETESYHWDHMELMQAHCIQGALDHGINVLQTTKDRDLRQEIYAEIDAIHVEMKNHEGGRLWAERCVKEFPEDCYAWMRLSRHLAEGSHEQGGTQADIDQAIRHMETAIIKAKASDEWVRECYVFLCSLLRGSKYYQRLEMAMRELLEDFHLRRKDDTAYIDDEWARRLPPNSVDPNLVALFSKIESATKAYVHEQVRSPNGCPAPNWEDLEPHLKK